VIIFINLTLLIDDHNDSLATRLSNAIRGQQVIIIIIVIIHSHIITYIEFDTQLSTHTGASDHVTVNVITTAQSQLRLTYRDIL